MMGNSLFFYCCVAQKLNIESSHIEFGKFERAVA
jgi:hypothetical protein